MEFSSLNFIKRDIIFRLWDAVLGGAPDILAYVGLSLLLASKRKILALQSVADFRHFISAVIIYYSQYFSSLSIYLF